jgi:hypothetical protein
MVETLMDEKTEFLTKLGGPKQYRKKLDELFRQRKLICLEIEQLVEDAYENDPVLRDTPEDKLNREMHKGIFQLSVVFESECDKSPYGMHAVCNAHQHHTVCIWCDTEVEGLWHKDLEKVHT